MLVFNTDIAREMAGYLLDIGAVKLSPQEPFTWASGIKSPIYCDNRMTLSHPALRDFIGNSFARVVAEVFPSTQVIAGVATGAIAHGLLAAERLKLPFVYVRDKPKEHGRQNQIEGELKPGQKVMVIEDLVSTGGSSLRAVEALRRDGAEVLGMAAIMTYGFETATEAFKKSDCALYTLTDYDAVIEVAQGRGVIDAVQLRDLQAWKKSLK